MALALTDVLPHWDVTEGLVPGDWSKNAWRPSRVEAYLNWLRGYCILTGGRLAERALRDLVTEVRRVAPTLQRRVHDLPARLRDGVLDSAPKLVVERWELEAINRRVVHVAPERDVGVILRRALAGATGIAVIDPYLFARRRDKPPLVHDLLCVLDEGCVVGLVGGFSKSAFRENVAPELVHLQAEEVVAQRSAVSRVRLVNLDRTGPFNPPKRRRNRSAPRPPHELHDRFIAISYRGAGPTVPSSLRPEFNRNPQVFAADACFACGTGLRPLSPLGSGETPIGFGLVHPDRFQEVWGACWGSPPHTNAAVDSDWQRRDGAHPGA